MQWLLAAEAGSALDVSGSTIRRYAGGVYLGHRIHERDATEEDYESGISRRTRTLYALQPITEKDERHSTEKPPDQPPNHVAARVFENEAVKLRIVGLTYPQIAQKLGMSLGAVHTAVKRSIEAVEQDTRERARELLELDLQRLDTLQASLWETAVEGDDKAHKQVLAIMRHRAKILGVTGGAPKNQWNIQINNASTGEVEETISDTPPGMLTPKQIRTYQDPAEAAKLEREIIKLQNEQIEYRQRTGELVEKRAVGSTLHRIGRLVRDRLLKFPSRLANKLVGLDAEGVSRALDEEVRDILGEMIDDIRRTMELEYGDDDDDVVEAEFVESS